MTLSHAHIVIIDDDSSTLDMLGLVLEEAGSYRVTATPHVFAEPMALEHLHPDLLLMDVPLPAPSPRWTFLNKLRCYEPTSQLPVLIMTTVPPTLFEQQPLLAQQRVSLLYKPFAVEALLHTITDLLSSSKQNSVHGFGRPRF